MESLYVDEISADYFVLKSQQVGSTVDFAWQLSGLRRGYGAVRMAVGGGEYQEFAD